VVRAYQAHHLIEVRHIMRWSRNVYDAPATVLTRTEHNMWTQRLRAIMPYGGEYTSQEVYLRLRIVYAGKPDWIKAAGEFLGEAR
jgi:hypothetical protein